MTMRITTQMVDNTNLAQIDGDLTTLDQTQEQLSTGFKINQASDDPYGESQALALNAQIASYTSYGSSINSASSWVESSTAALQSIQTVVNNMQGLTTEAANGTMSPNDLKDAAAQVLQYIGELKQTADTQYDGSYIFSGTATNTAPYNEDINASDQYNGSKNTSTTPPTTDSISYAIGPGTTLPINSDLYSVLGDGFNGSNPVGDGKLLSTMRTIYNDMTSTNGGTQADLGNQLTALQKNLSSLEVVEATAGATQTRLGMALTRIQTLQETDQTQLGNVEDTNIAQATLQYSTEQSGYQAALQSTASIVQTSLMKFLQG